MPATRSSPSSREIWDGLMSAASAKALPVMPMRSRAYFSREGSVTSSGIGGATFFFGTVGLENRLYLTDG